MPRLRNKKHEAYAQEIARGSEQNATYRKLFNYKGKHADSLASHLSRILKTRVSEIQKQVENDTFLTISEKRAFYAEALRCKVSRLPLDSRLLQSVKRTRRKSGRKVTEEIIEVRAVDKLKAIEDDSRLAGDLVDKVEHSGKIDQNHSGEIYLNLPRVIAGPRPLKKEGT